MTASRTTRTGALARLVLVPLALLGVLSFASSGALHLHDHAHACCGVHAGEAHLDSHCPACALAHVAAAGPTPPVVSPMAPAAKRLPAPPEHPREARVPRSLRARAPPTPC
jgi:hypothetical protein